MNCPPAGVTPALSLQWKSEPAVFAMSWPYSMKMRKARTSPVPRPSAGRAHLKELGINCLELLPIADSFADRSWGYATSNYFAPDFDLGRPDGNSSSTA